MTEMACDFVKNVLGINKPKAALLSYSTCGSGKGEDVDKVRHAFEIIKQNPNTLWLTTSYKSHLCCF